MEMKLADGAFALALAASPALAHHEGHGAPEAPAPPPADPHEGHEMSSPAEPSAAGEGQAMTGALGPYPLRREASGTAWQPDASPHGGLHLSSGAWTLMRHAALHGVYDRQGGPGGRDKAFVSGMVMGMARRPVGSGTVQLRASLSPDPLMGRRGYPLLLAVGETANGVDPLVDRQPPHDLFMELSASYSLPLSRSASLE